MNKTRKRIAQLTAQNIRKYFNLTDGYFVKIGLVLGTGWGNALRLSDCRELKLSRLAGFESLEKLEGHAGKLKYGRLEDNEILVLSGRVHLNESPSGNAVPDMVRLQVEILFHLGVRILVVASAVGSLRKDIFVGDVVIVDGFVTLFAPPMPLWGGEFCSPEDTLDSELCNAATLASPGLIKTHLGGHVMVRGPFFEGRRYDKKILASTGASVVGMSMLPEACIAALYNVKTLGLGFVTNTAFEEHSHGENLARAKASSNKLSQFIQNIVRAVANYMPQSSSSC